MKNDKKRIEDLERRVKELEARPIAPTIIVLPAQPPAIPYVPFIPWYQPVAPITEPYWCVTTSTTITV